MQQNNQPYTPDYKIEPSPTGSGFRLLIDGRPVYSHHSEGHLMSLAQEHLAELREAQES